MSKMPNIIVDDGNTNIYKYQVHKNSIGFRELYYIDLLINKREFSNTSINEKNIINTITGMCVHHFKKLHCLYQKVHKFHFYNMLLCINCLENIYIL